MHGWMTVIAERQVTKDDGRFRAGRHGQCKAHSIAAHTKAAAIATMASRIGTDKSSSEDPLSRAAATGAT
jgi:hypothetical protein